MGLCIIELDCCDRKRMISLENVKMITVIKSLIISSNDAQCDGDYSLINNEKIQ